MQSDKSTKTVALVDPVCNTVEMNHRIADKRGLRGFESCRLDHDGTAVSTKQNVKQLRPQISERRRRIKEHERQTAEINISHDGDYATAVCMAFDSPDLHPEGRRIVDTGVGPPMHEPEWGDVGWLDQDDTLKRTKENLPDTSEPSVNQDTYWTALQEELVMAEQREEWRIPSLPQS